MSGVKFLLLDPKAINVKMLWNFVEKLKPGSAIFKAHNVEKALEILDSHTENLIVICTKDFDEDGISFISRVKERYGFKNSLFILSSRDVSTEQTKRALQAGVDNFIEQPYELLNLIPKLKAAVDIISSKIEKTEAIKQYMELKEEFDKEILKLQEIIDIILEKRLPGVLNKIETIEKAAVWIAQRYGKLTEVELNNINLASKMIYTGRVYLDDKLIKEPIMKDGRLNDQALKEIPSFTEEIISRIKGYQPVASIIKSLYENFDGTGFPEGKRGGEIPVQSRILRVVSDFYDILESENEKYDVAMEKIIKETPRLYDHYVVAFIDQYLANFQPGRTKNETSVSLKELIAGQILSRNIYTKVGHNLISADSPLSDDSITMIRETATTDGIIGQIYIYDVEVRNEMDD